MGYVTYANMSDMLKVSGSNGGNPGEVATMSISGGSGTYSQYSFKYTLDGFTGSGKFLIPSVDGNNREIVRACIVPGQSNECQNMAGVNDQVGHKMWSGYVYYALRYFAKSGSTFEIRMNDANIAFTESNIYNHSVDQYGNENNGHMSNTSLSQGNNVDNIYQTLINVSPVSIQFGNIPFFATIADADKWLIEGGDAYPEVETKTYILSSNSYKSSNPLGENAEYLNHTVTSFDIASDVQGRVCGYVLDVTDNSNFDIEIKYSDSFRENATNVKQQLNATIQDKSSLSAIVNPYHKYSNIRYMADSYIFGKILPETNIPIFASVGDADSYIGGGNPTPIYDGGGGGSEDNETGEDEKETKLNETSENQPVLSSVYVCDRSALQSFAETLYSTSTDIINAITDGLKRYGENPINFVVDCFYVPFNVSSFLTQESVSQLPFGSYNADISGNIKKVTHNNTLLTIADFYFDSAYNDFRDYDYNYYLYLPYIGISVIDVEQFLNKNIQIKAFFDIRTGNIKYYIFANQKMIKTFEGNIRVAMPLTGSDKAAQASQYISGAESVIGGSFNTGFNIGSAVASGGASLSTGMGGIGNGISSIINGAIELSKSAPKQISGNNSPSTAIKDTIYPYLIIERPSYSTDSTTIRNQFNKPDYNYRIVENCSGYVKFTDFNLISDCNADEYNEIIKLLTIGIYV